MDEKLNLSELQAEPVLLMARKRRDLTMEVGKVSAALAVLAGVYAKALELEGKYTFALEGGTVFLVARAEEELEQSDQPDSLGDVDQHCCIPMEEELSE